MAEAGFLTESDLTRKASNVANGYDEDGRRRKKKQDTQDQVELAQVFDCLPGELAIALERALVKLDIELNEIPTSVKMMGVEIQVPFSRASVGEKEKYSVGWGTYDIAGLGKVQLSTANNDMNGSLTCFPKRVMARTAIWDKIIDQVREELPKVGLFKNKAFKITKPRDLILPNYLDLSADIKLILNRDVEAQLDVSLWRVIKHWDKLEGKIRRKRGVVLSGNYGAGKTLTALATAQMTVANGLTFFTTIANMATIALEVARVIHPSVIFLEDLDQAAHGDRDNLNHFLNTLSGIESKNTDMILLVSTNFVDRIDPAFLRPERLDTIVEFVLPTRDTVERIIRAYSYGLLPEGIDISAVVDYLVGATPAIISEAVTLAKIKAITEDRSIDPAELMVFAHGLDKQRNLACPKFVADTNAIKLETALKTAVNSQSDN